MSDIHRLSSHKPITPIVKVTKPTEVTKTETVTESVPVTPAAKPEVRPTAPATEAATVADLIASIKPESIGAHDQLMSTTVKSPEAVQADFDEALQTFNDDQHLGCSATTVEHSESGSMKTNFKDLLLLKYNPLASREAKMESDIFRAFCTKEFSTENCNFLDAAHDLKKLAPGSQAFDQKMADLFDGFVQDGSKSMINVSYKTRAQSEKAFKDFKAAIQNYKDNPTPENSLALKETRTKALNTLNVSIAEVNRLGKDTLARYSNDPFKADILASRSRSPFQLKLQIYKENIVDEAIASAKAAAEKTGEKSPKLSFAASSRMQAFRKNGEIFRDYQKTLKDPDWKAKLEARKAHIAQVIKLKEKTSGYKEGTFMFGLYNMTVAPWKSWKL